MQGVSRLENTAMAVFWGAFPNYRNRICENLY